MISHSSQASRAKQKPLNIIDRVHRQKDLMLDKGLTMLDKVFNGEHNLRKIGDENSRSIIDVTKVTGSNKHLI